MYPAMVETLARYSDEFRHAAHNAQVILTTHSPDLLDEKSVDLQFSLSKHTMGKGQIAPMDDASRFSDT